MDRRAGPRNLGGRRPISLAVLPPLAWIALAFTIGDALALAVEPPRSWVLAGALVGSLALVAAAVRVRAVAPAVLVQAALLGGLAEVTAWPQAPPELYGERPVVVFAEVAALPTVREGEARLLVELRRLTRGRRTLAARGRVRVALGGLPVEPLLPGDRVRFRARLLPPRGFVELDAPDPRPRFAEQGLVAVAALTEPTALIRFTAGADGSWRRRLGELRGRLGGAIRRRLRGDAAALVASMVLGERDAPRAELEESFRRAGVSHVLSVSGLHLAAAGFLCFVVLRRLLLRWEALARRLPVRCLAAAAALPAVTFYTLLSGAEVATVRAAVVAWFWLGAAAAGRAVDGGLALAGAALFLLAGSPLALVDPSFQLSFAAALAGLAFAGPTLRLLDRRATPRRRDGTPSTDGDPAPRGSAVAALGGRLRAAAGPLGRLLLGLVITSFAAGVATAPITAWHFAEVSTVGLLANPVVVPLAEAWVLPVGLVGCAVATVSPTAAGPLFDLAGLGAEAMAAACRWFAAWAPAGSLRAPTVATSLLALAGLALLAARRRGPLLVGAVLLLAAAGLHLAEPLGRRLAPALQVTFLDIGQGDAALVELPGGGTMLVDGGGSWDPEFDPGRRVIGPWLARRGVRRLDRIVLTHPHPDHANGLVSLLDELPVGEVWTNGAPSTLPAIVRLSAIAARKGVPVRRPYAFAEGGATVEVLHPLQGGAVRVGARWSENDGSIVLRLGFGRGSVLLTGDIEGPAEARLLAQGVALGATVVKVPHHGSRTSSSPRFVAAVHPAVAVISVGAHNRWHFPAARVVARWRGAGARVLGTDEHGAVRVRLDGSGGVSVTTAMAPRVARW